MRDNGVSIGVDIEYVVIFVNVVVGVFEEGRNGGVEVEIVALQEEKGYLSGRGGDLAEGVYQGFVVVVVVIVGLGFLGFAFHCRRESPPLSKL